MLQFGRTRRLERPTAGGWEALNECPDRADALQDRAPAMSDPEDATMKAMARASLLLTALTLCGAAFGSPPSEDYELVWADEFDGTELDTSKWEYRQLGPRRDAINAKDCVSLDGEGNLVLETRNVDGEYHTAMIGTQGKFEATFGYFECRVRLQTQLGHWSAFWLQSPTVSQVGDTRANGVEMDIFEYLVNAPDLARFNLHWDGYGDDHKSSGSTSEIEGFGEGFHTVGLEWTPDGYVFYVDDEKAWETSDAPSHIAEYIILSLEVGPWAGDIADAMLPDDMLVDYVRVYQMPD